MVDSVVHQPNDLARQTHASLEEAKLDTLSRGLANRRFVYTEGFVFPSSRALALRVGNSKTS